MMANGKKEEFEEDKKPENSVGTFPKMASKCKIKQVVLKKGGQDIRFDNFTVSSEQTGLLDSLIETGEDVLVTISPVQGRLPLKE